MTEIQQNRYDQLVRRVNNIVAPGSMVGDALSELFPTIDVESLLMELMFLSGTKHGFGSTALASSAGNNNHHQLFNPAESGNIVILTRVTFHSTVAQQINYVTANIALTDDVSNLRVRDTRDGILAQPVAELRTVQIAGSLPTVGALFVINNVNSILEKNNGLFVLAPGTGITFATTTQNTTNTLTWFWRERVAQAAELNF